MTQLEVSTPPTFGLYAVGFLDTLGAKALSDDENFLRALVVVTRATRCAYREGFAADASGLRLRWFSDNLGASVKLDGLTPVQQAHQVDQLTRVLVAVHIYLLIEFGILSRGAVTVGSCYHDKDVIFGAALVEAVELEWQANIPQILISPTAQQVTEESQIPRRAPDLLRTRPSSRHDGTSGVDAIDALEAELGLLADGVELAALLQLRARDALETCPADQAYRWRWVQGQAHRLAEALMTQG